MEGEPENQQNLNGLQEAPEPNPRSIIINPSTTAIPPTGPDGSITWTATEFVAHNKNATWYLILGLVVIVLAALIYLITKDKVTTAAILVAGLVLGIGATKKPRLTEFRLDNEGLTIGGKLHPYNLYRAFALDHKEEHASIVLFPLRRFSLLTQVYYDPKDEEKIVALISSYLPLDEKKRDLLDEIMWRIRY